MNKLMFSGLLVVVLMLGLGLYLGPTRNLNAAGTLSVEEMKMINGGVFCGEVCEGSANCGTWTICIPWYCSPAPGEGSFPSDDDDNPDTCVAISLRYEGNGKPYTVCTFDEDCGGGHCENKVLIPCGVVTSYLGTLCEPERLLLGPSPYYHMACSIE